MALAFNSWLRAAITSVSVTCLYASLVYGQSQFPEVKVFDVDQQDVRLNASDDPAINHTSPSTYWSIKPVCTSQSQSSTKYCLFTSSTFANGRGISIVTSPDDAEEFIKLPAFKDSNIHRDLGVNQFTNPPFVARQTENRGIGLFANRTIKRGESLLISTPAFMIALDATTDLKPHAMLELQRRGFQSLPRKLRILSENLDNNGRGGDFTDAIINTNSYGFPTIPTAEDLETGNRDPRNAYSSVFPEISRLNHACRPNARYDFNPLTLTMHVSAVRDIFSGEELTVSYIYQIQKRRSRLKNLFRDWRFKCSCSHCAASSEYIVASDARIDQILELQDQLDDPFDIRDITPATPAIAERLLSLFEQDHLWSLLTEMYFRAATEYSGAGNARKAQMYANLALRSGLMCEVGHEDYNDINSLAKDPRSHSSWMSFEKR